MIAGKYLAYPEYKDSEITWLGNIPVSWNVLAIKMLSEIYNGATPKSGEELFWDGEISWVTPADLGKTTSPYISVGSRSITIKGYESCGTSLVPKDSIILSSRAPIGTLGIALSDLSTNQGCKSLVVKKGFYPKFLYYVLLSSAQQLNLLGRGTTFLELSSDELGTYKISSPSGIEQEQIANFLDHETTKIDTLIEKQQQLIKLLKEKRQAVISHAVTKGLSPNAPMRDSGVEWLGEIPKHWGVSRIGFHAVKIGSGKTPKGGSEIYQDEGILFLRSQNIYDNGLKIATSESVFISSTIHEEMSGTTVLPGDVLLNITGGSIGRSCLVPYDFDKANVNQHVCILRFPAVLNKYLSYILKADLIKEQIDSCQTGGNREGLNFEQISKLIVCVPPEAERTEILNHIELSIQKYDDIEKKSTAAILLMQERRTALISAAVTGKIDVRNFNPEDRYSNNNSKKLVT